MINSQSSWKCSYPQKGICKKPSASITTLWYIPYDQEYDKMLTTTASTQHYIASPSQCSEVREKNKRHKLERKK
jgi:hypothetical protein